jgi:hypothetical protein
MRAVYVPLRADVKDALLTLVEREARDPRRQAARLLQERLIRAGVLTNDRSAILTTDPRGTGTAA